MKTRILFVCLGNICRSPAAEGILCMMAQAQGMAHDLEIDSAGTYGGHTGQLPDPRMRSAALRRGYWLGHRARRVTGADFDRFDRIVAMDRSNYEALRRLAPSPQAADRIVCISEFFRRYAGHAEVPDPYYQGDEGFERVLDMLEDACSALLDSLKH